MIFVVLEMVFSVTAQDLFRFCHDYLHTGTYYVALFLSEASSRFRLEGAEERNKEPWRLIDRLTDGNATGDYKMDS